MGNGKEARDSAGELIKENFLDRGKNRHPNQSQVKERKDFCTQIIPLKQQNGRGKGGVVRTAILNRLLMGKEGLDRKLAS